MLNKNNFLASEKNKAILIVSFTIVALSIAHLFQGIRLHSNTIDQVIQDKDKSINSTVNNLDQYFFAPYVHRMVNLLAIHPEIADAFAKQDRELLLNRTLPLYKSLKRESKYFHVMHYHLPDGNSFLRMHKPDKFGDDLRQIRPAVQHVHKEKLPVTGYEIGIFGAYYRIIHPIFYQGSYVGALEFGIRAHVILASLQKQISEPITTFYNTDRWRKVIYPPEATFLQMGDHTLNAHDKAIYQQFPSGVDLSVDNQQFTINDNSFLMHAFPVFNNFQGEPIGGFVVLQNISRELAAKQNYILRSLLFTCIFSGLALLVLYLSFGALIGKLERSRHSLKDTVDKLGLEVEERKKTEKALYKSKEEWERTFNAIGDIVTIMDGQFQIIKANQATYKLLNAEPNSLEGKFCYDVFSNKTEACDGCPGVDTIEMCQIHSAEIEHDNLGKSFLITTSPIPGEHGDFSHIVHIAKDITEKKELETKLRQAQKMEAIGTLAGGIAHDFNNILTSIFGNVELAMFKIEDETDPTKYFKRIHGAAVRAKDLVKQILTFSHQSKYQKRPLQISLIVKEALKLLRSSVPSTIELKSNITTQKTVLADPTQIHQIIMNLGTNAYHAMKETGGILGVSLQDVSITEHSSIPGLEIEPGNYICLEVSDTGKGMDAATKEKIFEPYFTTKPVGEGTGLGLAVVHGIVKSHNGLIHVQIESGLGTTFRVYLPTVSTESDDFNLDAIQEPTQGGKERIMFIDDEESILSWAYEFLTHYGYHTTTFNNCVQAMHNFNNNPDDYDLIITDMTMPNLTGVQLAQKIKEVRPNLPIILCTGYSDLINKEKALAMGINRYLQKPLANDKLAKVIREILDEK